MTTKPSKPTTLRNQQGAALVVSLVVLVIITILATAGIGSASMQQKMAANIQQQNETFQAAEGSLATLLNTINGDTAISGDPDKLAQALKLGTGTATPVNFSNTDLSITDQLTVTTTVMYLSTMETSAGNSLDADENSTIIPGHRFILTGQADKPSGASTQIELGIEYD